jgi:hypothetical protein
LRKRLTIAGKFDTILTSFIILIASYCIQLGGNFIGFICHSTLLNDLMWEASTNIRKIKAKLATGQKVDLVAKESKVQSQVCAGEQWTATATDGAVMLAFSHLSDLRAVLYIDGSNLIKSTYKIKPLDKIEGSI